MPLPVPRVGIVDYANVAPLIDGLEPDWPLSRATPARLADLLALGELDVAILPTIELARIPGLRAIPGLGIAADGACGSVFLFTKVPLRDVKSVTLDTASRTSAALSRILLDREGAREIRFVKMEGGSVVERLADADATLLIGDPALRAEWPADVTRLDLATEWKRHVGLPFVFACWATRRDWDLSQGLRTRLEAAADRGLTRLPEHARIEAARTGLSAEALEGYLRQLNYRLDERHVQGLRAFLDEALRVGVLSERADLDFLQ